MSEDRSLSVVACTCCATFTCWKATKASPATLWHCWQREALSSLSTLLTLFSCGSNLLLHASSETGNRRISLQPERAAGRTRRTVTGISGKGNFVLNHLMTGCVPFLLTTIVRKRTGGHQQSGWSLSLADGTNENFRVGLCEGYDIRNILRRRGYQLLKKYVFVRAVGRHLGFFSLVQDYYDFHWTVTGVELPSMFSGIIFCQCFLPHLPSRLPLLIFSHIANITHLPSLSGSLYSFSCHQCWLC